MRNFKHPHSKKTLDKTVGRLLNEILSVTHSHHSEYLTSMNDPDVEWNNIATFPFNVLVNPWHASQSILPGKSPFKINVQVLNQNLYERTHMLNRDWKVLLSLYQGEHHSRIGIRFPVAMTHSWLGFQIDNFNVSLLPNHITTLVRIQSSRYERLAYVCSDKYLNKALAFLIREVDDAGFKMGDDGCNINKEDTIITEHLTYGDLEQMTPDELYIRLHVFKRDKHEDGVDSILVPFRDYLQMLYMKGKHKHKQPPIPTFRYQSGIIGLPMVPYEDPTVEYNCFDYKGDGESSISIDYDVGDKATHLYPMMQDQIHTALCRHNGAYSEHDATDIRSLTRNVDFDFTAFGSYDYILATDKMTFHIVTQSVDGDPQTHIEVNSKINDTDIQTIKVNDEFLELDKAPKGKLVQLSGLVTAHDLILKRNGEYQAFEVDPLNSFTKAFVERVTLPNTLKPICPQFEIPTPLYIELEIEKDVIVYVHLLEHLRQRIAYVQLQAYVKADGLDRTDVELDRLLVYATIYDSAYHVSKENLIIEQLRQMEHSVVQYRKLLSALLEDTPTRFVDNVKTQILDEVRTFERHPSSKEQAFIGIGHHTLFFCPDDNLTVQFRLSDTIIDEPLIKLPYLNYPFLKHTAVDPKYLVKLNSDSQFIIESEYQTNENLISPSVSTRVYSYFDLDVNSITYQLGSMTVPPEFLPLKENNNGNHYVSCTNLDDCKPIYIRLDVFIGMLLALPKVNTNDIV